MIGHDSGAEPMGPLELYNEGISTLKKNHLPQLHLNAVDKELFTAAVKDIIKQPLTFTMGVGGGGGETEDGDSDGGQDDENDGDDCDGDSIVVDNDIHEGSTADFEAVRERESSSSEMLTCKCKS